MTENLTDRSDVRDAHAPCPASAQLERAAQSCRPFVTRVRSEVDPLLVYERLRPSSARALLESAELHEDPAQCRLQRSILVARAVLALELRGEVLSLRALGPEARPLLGAIRDGVPGSRGAPEVLALRAPRLEADPLQDDAERLRRAEPALALIRAFSRLLRDAAGSDAGLAPGAYGALGFDMVDRFEDLPPRAAAAFGERDEADASFVLASDTLVFAPAFGEVEVVTRGLPWEAHESVRARHASRLALLDELAARGAVRAARPRASRPKAAEPDIARAEFEAGVRALVERVREGDVFQVVPSRALRMQTSADSLAIYRALRARNPSPYLFHFELEDGALLGASPETFLRVEGGELELRPIAGTARRGLRTDGGVDARRDERLALQLCLDAKEQKEHAMLIDLARNDVARVAEVGSTRVVQQLAVEKFAQVQHLVSRVRGKLRVGFDAFDAYRVCANPGTLTGAPKLRAMQRIRELEKSARGYYGGAFGYFLEDGRHDSCIVIRSLRVRGSSVVTRVGAGVVEASDPRREWEETEAKSLSVRLAVADAEREASPASSAARAPASATRGARVLVVDHEDSFVFNLVDEVRQLGCDVRTTRASVPLADLEALLASFDPELVVLSPGPGAPEDAGVTPAWLRSRPDRPVLGVCLGHQAIAQSFGARVRRAARAVHGRGDVLRVHDAGRALLGDGGAPFARYHSLVVDELPDELEVLATLGEGRGRVVMAIRHRRLPWIGVQFHPESQLSPDGPSFLARVLDEARAYRTTTTNSESRR